jgi:hypothetical protein
VDLQADVARHWSIDACKTAWNGLIDDPARIKANRHTHMAMYRPLGRMV